MTEKFKILAQFIKDASSETPDIETYLFVKENISKYQLNIDITSKALKNKLIEVNTTLKFEDKELNEKKSYYEIVYATIIKVNEEIKEKTGYNESEVIKIMRKSLKPSAFRLWRKRVHNKSIKHRKKFNEYRKKLREKIRITDIY